jgi:hypothetical protein
MTVCRKTLQDVQLRFRGRAKSLLALSQTRTTRSSGKTGPFSCNSVLCHPMLAEPPDHEEDCSKNDRKKYEQAYYISHPARRQGIIDVSVICFLFVSFHVVTPFVRVPPLPRIRLLRAIYFCLHGSSLPENAEEGQP